MFLPRLPTARSILNLRDGVDTIGSAALDNRGINVPAIGYAFPLRAT
jgi:hypothetical protein